LKEQTKWFRNHRFRIRSATQTSATAKKIEKRNCSNQMDWSEPSEVSLSLVPNGLYNGAKYAVAITGQ